MKVRLVLRNMCTIVLPSASVLLRVKHMPGQVRVKLGRQKLSVAFLSGVFVSISDVFISIGLLGFSSQASSTSSENL